MKITVRVDETWYEVEVGDLYARPVIASVDGEYFEVWPEVGPPVKPKPSPQDILAAGTKHPPIPSMPRKAAPRAEGGGRGVGTNAVYAPIPGVIISVAVTEGSQVTQGQELCVLEAMKMKNVIRAPRSGVISRVMVAANDHVQHHDLLFEYQG